MDWDLWSMKYDSEESRFYSQTERQCDYYFGYGFDMIEEAALNEKYCMQVLRILITKADTEIDELEKDLISLQSELAWIENDGWSEICCDALTEKINCLDISIKSLLNKDKNDVEVHLLMHTQPIETLNDILKDLLSNNLCKKHEQHKEVKNAVLSKSRLDNPREAISIKGGSKKRGNFNSQFLVKKQMRESSPTTEHSAVCPSLKLLEWKTNDLEIVETANASVEDSNSHSLKVADIHSDGEILPSNLGPKNAGKGEGSKQIISPKDQIVIRNSSSESADKGRDSVENAKVQPINAGVSNAISDASENAEGNSNEKKEADSSDSIFVSEEIDEQSSVSSADVSLGLSMALEVKQADPGEKIKLANAFLKGSGLETRGHTAEEFSEMENLSKSILKVSGNEDYSSKAPGKSKPLRSSLNTEIKGDSPTKNKHADFVKKVDAEAFRCTTGLDGRKGNSDAGFGTFSNPDIKQKLSDFALKGARKQTIKQSKVAVTEKLISSSSSLKAGRKQKSPRRIVKAVEAALTETENCALTSLLERPEKKGKNSSKIQPSEEGKTMPEVHTRSEICVDNRKTKLNLSLNLQKEKVKSIMRSNALTVQDGISTLRVDSSLPIKPKAKKRRNSLFDPINPSLLGYKTTRKVGQLDESEHSNGGESSGDSPKSVSQSQKKRKKTLKFPIVAEVGDFSLQMYLTGSQSCTTDSSSKDELSIIESSICDSGSEAAASLPPASILEKMKLADLRDVAKRQKLTKYYKLSKKAILQQLVGRTDDS